MRCFQGRRCCAAEDVAWVAPERAAKVTGNVERQKTAADPTKADVVVSAGRGFAAEEDLQKARDLAAKLGGAIACSRPLTEGVNWLPTELYVGVSGITVTRSCTSQPASPARCSTWSVPTVPLPSLR